MLNKLASYNLATEKLASQAMGFNVENHGRFSLADIVRRLRDSFKYRLTYKKVYGRNLPEDGANPSTDYCKIASYYIFNRTGADKYWSIAETPVHWWLVYKPTGQIFDVTYDQFDGGFPYHLKPDGLKFSKTYLKDRELRRQLIETSHILGQCAGME